MNKKMTDLARGRKCGRRGANGFNGSITGIAAVLSAPAVPWSKPLKATAPKPAPVR